MRTNTMPGLWMALLALAALPLAACGASDEGRLPADAELDGLFGERVEITLNGNVVDVRVDQSPDQLRRGGPIWAKAGPYIYLFTPQTRTLFEEYPGVGGVRVTTLDGRGDLVARALLERSSLTSVTWTRAINAAGRARIDGTRRPQLMVDLAELGEEYTDYEYSHAYAGSN